MTQNKQPFRFPKRFLWGVSLSAYQSEGGNHNNWTEWELENAKTLAAQSQYTYGNLSNWDAIKSQAQDPDNYVTAESTKHYELYEHDFDLAKKMNMNAFRFSLEWSRIEPTEGSWDAAAIEHYKRYIAELNKRGLEPVMTLVHYTMPVWFAKMGGFEKRSNTKYYLRFVEKVLQEIGGGVKYIITFNEPEVYVAESYIKGDWTPNKNSLLKAFRVVNNIIYAHNQSAKIIHASNRRYKVSIAKQSVYYYAGDDALLSRFFAGVFQYVQDDYILKRVVKQSDFIGVNYYFANRVYGYRIHNPENRISDLGWDLSPEILQQCLERLHDKYNMPIIVTENGLADATDEDRKWWLSHSLIAMQKAIEYGVDLQGYIHWSLIDNVELDKGRWPRFGLFAVDYKTSKRTPRASAIWYAGILKRLRAEE